ncbi:Sodium-dependent phosphate transporter [Phytophthora megakarya]|uniref:Sodium-dependent phosphate transporter n=1 Tax=Phytophthora megakarya TaxID=4795 RepID=A0A225WVL5_9STRA|nr:Sodium-dependent phosphate transporter [Phytophthora megakarya]
MDAITLLSPDTYSRLQVSVFSENSSDAGSPHYQYDKEHIEYYDEEDEEVMYTGHSLFQKIVLGLFCTVIMLAALYFFMVAVKFIESGFTVALGCDVKGAFTIANNPLAGLVIGLVSTALLHSSSTITSITVALVSTQGLTIRQGVFIVMGANIGTCVTCIMMAFGQIQTRSRFQRAMETATVHTMFNVWSAFIMFPLEVIFHPLEKLSVLMSNAKASGGSFTSPVDTVVKPFANLLIRVDTQAILDITSGTKECTDEMSLVSGGAFEGTSLSDGQIGVIVIVIGFLTMAGSLICFIQMLAMVLLGPTKILVSRMLAFNGYVNILAGAGITFIVQSSTVVTCTLTPMAGLGVFTLEQVYPLILGANLGTCGTALLASLVVGTKQAVAVALTHLWFNMFGIVLFYPIPFTRRPILSWARSIAYFSASWAVVGVLFILVVYLVLPGVLLGLEQLCTANERGLQTLGYVLTGVGAFIIASGLAWYHARDGRQRWHNFLEHKYADREDFRGRDETAMLSDVKDDSGGTV